MILPTLVVLFTALMVCSRERKRVPYVGKHTKRIVSAVWNKDNLLAMAGLDRTVSWVWATAGLGQTVVGAMAGLDRMVGGWGFGGTQRTGLWVNVAMAALDMTVVGSRYEKTQQRGPVGRVGEWDAI